MHGYRRQYFPNVPCRLQLSRVNLQKMAKDVGIDPANVYALNSLKGALMSCSIKAPVSLSPPPPLLDETKLSGVW